VSFRQETLNQYNRKRIVQTGHEFEPLQVKFHDTVNPALRQMFVEYYQFYYGDSKIYGAGSSGSTVYDVVTGEGFSKEVWLFFRIGLCRDCRKNDSKGTSAADKRLCVSYGSRHEVWQCGL
jgi:hypothetical protein